MSTGMSCALEGEGHRCLNCEAYRAGLVAGRESAMGAISEITFELARERRAHSDARAVAWRAARAANLPVVSGDERGVVDMPGLDADRGRDTLFLHAPATPDINVPILKQTMNVVAIKRKVLMARLPCGIILRWIVPDEESLK